MSAVLAPVPPTADDLLAQLRAAWRAKAGAELTLSRLAKYARRTPGMKDDAALATRALREADETIRRILGGAA